MFNLRLKELREKKGLNQREFASDFGVSPATVGMWESGAREPRNLEQLQRIAEYFNVTPDYLLGIMDFDSASTALEHDINTPRPGEMDLLMKYRSLDQYGQKAVEELLETEYERVNDELKIETQDEPCGEIVYFSIPKYDSPMSAGVGEMAGQEYPDNILLVKEPPRGASYVAQIKGDSMEPTYHDGDMVFVAAYADVDIGDVGVFLMDGQQWVKERGEGKLISHNPKYKPRPMTEDIRCQGKVLGVCDSGYTG